MRGWMAGLHRDSTGLRHLGRMTRCGPRPPRCVST